MKFGKTSLQDAMVVDMVRNEDSRGFFARTFCAREFAEAGLVTEFVQGNHSYNRQRGTVRGMHFQTAPHGEVKLVRCVAGAVLDIIIDLRASSPSYLKWEGFELSAANGRTLYVPVGFAHGFQTLADETHVLYSVSHPYTPGAEGGVRHDDPVFGITWPLPLTVISDKDRAWPLVDLAQGIRILGMILPNFLIIGAAKAGTTSLYDWLRQHPDVFMPALKEPKFFAYDPERTDVAWPVRTLQDYAALFAGATERAVGEASPNYLNSSPAMHKIRETLPQARLIAALRDPAERAFSVYQMNLRNLGRNRATPFAEALATDVNLRQGYAKYLERWFGLFDRSQFRIVLFEEIAKAPLETVQGLFGFLGVDDGFAPETSVSNPGGLPRVKLVHDLLSNERVRGLGRILPEPLLARARDLRARNLKRQGMTPDERRLAAAFFRDDVLRTQELIGRDLSAWLRA